MLVINPAKIPKNMHRSKRTPIPAIKYSKFTFDFSSNNKAYWLGNRRHKEWNREENMNQLMRELHGLVQYSFEIQRKCTWEEKCEEKADREKDFTRRESLLRPVWSYLDIIETYLPYSRNFTFLCDVMTFSSLSLTHSPKKRIIYQPLLYFFNRLE